MGNVSHGSICSEISMTFPFCYVHLPSSTTDPLGSLRQVTQRFWALCSHLYHKENTPMVVTGIQQAIKSEALRCGRCCVSVVLKLVLSLSLLCFGPPLHTCGSKPVQPDVQVCPIPSKSHCALEDDVMPNMDTKGNAASDRETEGGKSNSPRVLAPVTRALLQGQRPRPCHWAMQFQLPGLPPPLAPHIGLPGPTCRLP